MLGLGEEVGGDPPWVRGVVGDDRDLRRSVEAVDADDPGHLALRQRDVDVAGPDDHVDGADRLGAVGHRRDRLRATDAVHLVDTGEGGGGERDRRARCRRGRAARTARRRRHRRCAPGTAVISTRRRIGGTPAGHVAAGPRHRHDALGEADAVAIEGEPADALGGVVRPDLAVRVLERLADVGREAVEGRR